MSGSDLRLNFQQVGESGRPLIFIHGLFGSLANWRSVAREFADQYTVYVLDLRNHGGSAHSASMTYYDMAHDIEAFIRYHGLTDAIVCGHSMGGKASMVAALSGSAELQSMISGLVILDIAPVVYEHTHADNLSALTSIDLAALSSRADADQQLQALIPDNATRLFLLQSLERVDGQFRWKINIPVLQEYMDDIVGFPVADVQNLQSDLPALFLYGARSDYVTESMHGGIKTYFPNASFASVDAGHLLHIEQRVATIDAIRQFLIIA